MTRFGILDGLAILRFAHAFESGGGTERYLDDLDNTLLQRNAMTIVRLHLTRRRPNKIVEEFIGQGRLIRIPLSIVPEAATHRNGHHELTHFHLKKKLRDWVLYNPLIWPAVGARWTTSRRLPRKAGQAIGAGVAAAEVFQSNRIDFVALHFFGTADAEDVIDEAKKSAVPFALINHYSNDRLNALSVRRHVMSANAIAGVNGLNIPRYIGGRLVNLSDGIDIEFFQRARAQVVKVPSPRPVILLPARVVREKGQIDLIHAAALLHRDGIECNLAFAGRTDSSEFVAELHRIIEHNKMNGHVQFLGELDAGKLRDWYAASSVVALPTYHDEGLPRVIIEAQAMSVPVVAYAAGGVPDGITDGRTGFILRTGDVHGLANRLRELLLSPSLREKMGNSGREMVENHFSLTALAERHERFYNKVMGEVKSVTAPAVANLI